MIKNMHKQETMIGKRREWTIKETIVYSVPMSL